MFRVNADRTINSVSLKTIETAGWRVKLGGQVLAIGKKTFYVDKIDKCFSRHVYNKSKVRHCAVLEVLRCYHVPC